MFCPKCGVTLPAGSAFCASCGTRIAPSVGIDVVKRPTIITLLAVLQFIGAAFLLLGALASAVLVFSDPDAGPTGGIIVLAILGGLGVLQLMCGIGLWKLKPYGRTLQIVLAVIGLLAIPIGTIISILILIYLNKPGIKALFSDKSVNEYTPDELVAIAEVTRPSGAVIAVVVVLIVIGVIGAIGIVAAISVPALLRARQSANEATAIATIRNFQSAQVAYSSTANGGFFDTPECLSAPTRCIKSYTGEPFLGEPVDSTWERSGYSFTFEPGESADREAVQNGGFSPTSVTEFTFIAVPIQPGSTGRRSFCTDSSFTICQVDEGTLSSDSGRCPSHCTPIY